MKNIIIRKYEEKDFERILELNEASVHFLSPLSLEKLKHLSEEADILNVAELDGEVEAFILAFTENRDYDSVNYKWFSTHYPRFLYIDRVVVSVDKHGSGFGRTLYQNIFEYARSCEIPRLAAEIDLNPPNPISLKFHEKFGFKEVGKQSVYDGQKVVSLQIVDLD